MGESVRDKLLVLTYRHGTNVYGCFDGMIDLWMRKAKDGAKNRQLIKALEELDVSSAARQLKGALEDSVLKKRLEKLKNSKLRICMQ